MFTYVKKKEDLIMTKKNKTLLIIKPDAVRNKTVGNIIDIIEKNNITILNMNMIKLDANTAKKFYSEHNTKSFYDELINFIISGPIVVLILEGKEIITQVRNLIGNTNFKKADKGTIREKFATSVTENAVHASDSIKSFENEIKIISSYITHDKKI